MTLGELDTYIHRHPGMYARSRARVCHGLGCKPQSKKMCCGVGIQAITTIDQTPAFAHPLVHIMQQQRMASRLLVHMNRKLRGPPRKLPLLLLIRLVQNTAAIYHWEWADGSCILWGPAVPSLALAPWAFLAVHGMQGGRDSQPAITPCPADTPSNILNVVAKHHVLSATQSGGQGSSSTYFGLFLQLLYLVQMRPSFPPAFPWASSETVEKGQKVMQRELIVKTGWGEGVGRAWTSGRHSKRRSYGGGCGYMPASRRAETRRQTGT